MRTIAADPAPCGTTDGLARWPTRRPRAACTAHDPLQCFMDYALVCLPACHPQACCVLHVVLLAGVAVTDMQGRCSRSQIIEEAIIVICRGIGIILQSAQLPDARPSSTIHALTCFLLDQHSRRCTQRATCVPHMGLPHSLHCPPSIACLPACQPARGKSVSRSMHLCHTHASDDDCLSPRLQVTARSIFGVWTPSAMA